MYKDQHVRLAYHGWFLSTGRLRRVHHSQKPANNSNLQKKGPGLDQQSVFMFLTSSAIIRNCHDPTLYLRRKSRVWIQKQAIPEVILWECTIYVPWLLWITVWYMCMSMCVSIGLCLCTCRGLRSTLPVFFNWSLLNSLRQGLSVEPRAHWDG